MIAVYAEVRGAASPPSEGLPGAERDAGWSAVGTRTTARSVIGWQPPERPPQLADRACAVDDLQAGCQLLEI